MDKQTELLIETFGNAYNQLNGEQIAQAVDELGIDAFINNCASYAAVSGATTGLGGAITMVIGVPVDVINVIIQQFRVTLGVIYYKKGVYKVSFNDFMKIVGVSLGVEVGATIGKAILISIAKQILARLTASTASKAIPFVGGVVGGSINFGFIKFVGKAVKKVNMDEIKAN